MINLLILLFAVFFAYLFWKNLEWAVLIMLAAMPTYLIRFSAFGLPMTVLELMILISFFVWLVTKTNFKLFIRGQYSWREFKENRLKREKYPWRWEIVALLVISWVAIAVGGFTNGSLGIWKAYFFEPILVFILVLNLFSAQGGSASGGKEKKGIEKIIFALAFSAFAVSVLAIYQKLTGNLIDNPFWSAAATRRAVSFFGYPNAVGLYLGPIIMILVGYFHSVIASPDLSGRGNLEGSELNSGLLRRSTPRNDKIKKSFVALTIVLSLMSIYFAKSEGAIIALLVAFFVFGILAGKKIRWATLIAAIVIGSGVLVYAPARIHVLDLIQLHNFSGQVRTQQWKETRKMLTDGRLIFGAGLANYQKTIKPYHQEGIFVYDFHDPNFHAKLVASDELKKKVWQPTEIYLYPHNILLNFWSELGLAGMLLFIWIFIKFFYLSFGNWKLEIGNSVNQKNKYLILGLVGAMITIIIHGLVDVPYFKNDLSVLFWVMLAMVSLINWQNKSYA